MKAIAYYRLIKTNLRHAQLTAQRERVDEFVDDGDFDVFASFTERGKEFAELEKAIAECRRTGSTLLIAHIGKLVRSRRFLGALRDSGIEFTGVDDPHVNTNTIDVLAATAEEQALRKSRKTKATLQRLKAQGVKLGSNRPGHWDGRDRQWGKCVQAASRTRTDRTKEYYAFVTPRIVQMRADGETFVDIAKTLNGEGLVTQSGKPYTQVAVSRIYQRFQQENAS